MYDLTEFSHLVNNDVPRVPLTKYRLLNKKGVPQKSLKEPSKSDLSGGYKLVL
jgi:hypothetical protein